MLSLGAGSYSFHTWKLRGDNVAVIAAFTVAITQAEIFKYRRTCVLGPTALHYNSKIETICENYMSTGQELH